MINSYRKVFLNNLNKETRIAEVTFWYQDKLVDIQKVKTEDFNLVRF